MNDTQTLFRSVGRNELALIEQSGFTAFPPRLPEQPIFYPLLNEEYADRIARDWRRLTKIHGRFADIFIRTVEGGLLMIDIFYRIRLKPVLLI